MIYGDQLNSSHYHQPNVQEIHRATDRSMLSKGIPSSSLQQTKMETASGDGCLFQAINKANIGWMERANCADAQGEGHNCDVMTH
jgi:hypothetical protein